MAIADRFRADVEGMGDVFGSLPLLRERLVIACQPEPNPCNEACGDSYVSDNG